MLYNRKTSLASANLSVQVMKWLLKEILIWIELKGGLFSTLILHSLKPDLKLHPAAMFHGDPRVLIFLKLCHNFSCADQEQFVSNAGFSFLGAPRNQ